MWKHESRCVLPQQTFQSVTILDFTELCYHLVVKMKSPGWTGLWPQTASAGMFFFADCSSVQGHMWLLFLVPFKYRLPLWMSLWLTEWVFLIQGLTQIGKSFFKNLIKMFHRQSVCVCVNICLYCIFISPCVYRVHQCNNTEAHYLLFAACFRMDWSAAAFRCLTGPPALSSKDASGQDLCALALAGVSLFSI